jgi:hypothetical protein
VLTCHPVDHQVFTSGRLGQKVQAVIEAMQRRKQKDPHSKGFQRTPAFIHAVVQQLLSGGAGQEDEAGSDEEGGGLLEIMPRGGFTDVGQHTGSQARATAWPLVEQLLKVGGRACH